MVLFGRNIEKLTYISLQIENCKMSILSYLNACTLSFTLYWLAVFFSKTGCWDEKNRNIIHYIFLRRVLKNRINFVLFFVLYLMWACLNIKTFKCHFVQTVFLFFNFFLNLLKRHFVQIVFLFFIFFLNLQCKHNARWHTFVSFSLFTVRSMCWQRTRKHLTLSRMEMGNSSKLCSPRAGRAMEGLSSSLRSWPFYNHNDKPGFFKRILGKSGFKLISQ